MKAILKVKLQNCNGVSHLLIDSEDLQAMMRWLELHDCRVLAVEFAGNGESRLDELAASGTEVPASA